ncbi:carboxy-S-adenosyl-L-methionine synthase CmoA [Saccharobesus litoralis]|uniref:Carboxy-S-adenosyl-L-methionine synthase n=1 Tax=Saccharobesus litoralis TaxID=2172099 RepID=A0A2S0VSQ3_9ALTE|nr:carboxy-S-adenosyl-L-methionine synthase CmoA [Saccharobesus litoralis]AWB67239.1 carboxy-S-adenosyl-L-methionine synthase CmoA [Saccharobesus litoralis]
MSQPDNIYSQPLEQVRDFVFDKAVVDVFSDMILRSVPGYQTIISTIGHLAQVHCQDNSNVYDLGCSLGTATLAMRRTIKANNVEIIAVDKSADMVEKCRLHLQGYKSPFPTQVLCDDILNIDINNASIVILNFTLQFLQPADRQQLINRIYQGLKPGGLLVLSEKLKFVDQPCHDLIDELHLDFKRAHGYSELEISQKRAAIENVMRIDDLSAHYQRFKNAGFNHYQQWYQCFNFASMVAIK